MTIREQQARLWQEYGLDDGHTVFNQDLLVWSDEPDPVMSWAPNPGQYAIDLQLVSAQVLDWIAIADNPEHTVASAVNSRSVRDFGEQGRVTEDHQCSVYSIHDDRYSPGSFQNLILPRINRQWDNAPIGGTLETSGENSATVRAA